MSDIYNVEAILGRRTIRGRRFCRVKWEGWEKPTWEPVENIDGLRKTIDYPVPGKVYRVETGSRIATVRGVQRYEGEVVAMVQYADGTLEIVPTRFIGEQDPEKIIDFYEQLMHVPDKPASTEPGQADDEGPASRTTNDAKRLMQGNGVADTVAAYEQETSSEKAGNASLFRRTVSAVAATFFGSA